MAELVEYDTGAHCVVDKRPWFGAGTRIMDYSPT